MDVNEVAYQWRGVRTSDGTGWVEHFASGGKSRRLPPRDLTVGEVDALTPEQRALLDSPTGQRLYVPAKPKKEKAPPKGGKSAPDAKTGDKGGE